MRDWILGLQKAAAARQPGAPVDAIRVLEADVGQVMPEELRELYLAVNGAVFPSDVTLFPLRAGGNDRGLLERTRAPVEGLPRQGTWRFGLRGFGEHLFAAQKAGLAALSAELEMPAWFGALAPEAWVFGLKSEDTGELSVHKTLEQLLWTLIPPAETEEFGENTFSRALSAVELAMGQLGPPESEGSSGGKQKPSVKPERPAKRPAVKKTAKRKPAATTSRPQARGTRGKAPKGAAKKPKHAPRTRKRPARRRR
jgi:hypothetical protein